MSGRRALKKKIRRDFSDNLTKPPETVLGHSA